MKGIANIFMLKSLCYKVVFKTLILVLLSTNGFSQHAISKYEYRWALAHPISAIRVKQHLFQAMKIYKEVKSKKILDTLESGGKLDAFRHAFTMAYLTRYVKVKNLKKLGIAHEKGNKKQFLDRFLEFGERSDSLACEMDLKNNLRGFEIGEKNKNVLINELMNEVIYEIKTGNLFYLKRNDRNLYVNCQNEPINLTLYADKWFIPKCLIKTNL